MISECYTEPPCHVSYPFPHLPSQRSMHQRNDEVHVQLALQAMQNDTKLSARAAGKIYNVDHEKLSRRRRGMQPRRDIPANSRKLTDLEESIVVQYILDLDSKGFPPRLCGVEDMANGLLAERDARRIVTRWASNFVKRQPDLTMRFNRKYDYQRALCENPDLIRGWFALVPNTIAKYGIQGADIYNFDEIGFLMGVISTILVVTGSERRGRRKTRQPGNRKWSTVIQGINARGWAIPPFIIVEGSYHLSSWYENSRLPKGRMIFLRPQMVGIPMSLVWIGLSTSTSTPKLEQLGFIASSSSTAMAATTRLTSSSTARTTSSPSACLPIHPTSSSQPMLNVSAR